MKNDKKIISQIKKINILSKTFASFFISLFIIVFIAFFVLCFIGDNINIPGWATYLFVFSVVILLPTSVLMVISSLDQVFLKKLKLSIYEQVKSYYLEKLSKLEFKDFDLSKEVEESYKKINLLEFQKSFIEYFKARFITRPIKSLDSIEKIFNDELLSTYKEKLNKEIIAFTLIEYKEKTKQIFKQSWPDVFKERYYETELKLIEPIVQDFISGKKEFSIFFGYQILNIKLDLNYLIDRYLYLQDNDSSLKYIPNKNIIDLLNSKKKSFDVSIKDNNQSVDFAISINNDIKNLLDKYYVEDSSGYIANNCLLIKEKQDKESAKKVDGISISQHGFRYKNRCWSCGAAINEDWYKSSRKCYSCGYFKCRNCGKCFCNKT